MAYAASVVGSWFSRRRPLLGHSWGPAPNHALHPCAFCPGESVMQRGVGVPDTHHRQPPPPAPLVAYCRQEPQLVRSSQVNPAHTQCNSSSSGQRAAGSISRQRQQCCTDDVYCSLPRLQCSRAALPNKAC